MDYEITDKTNTLVKIVLLTDCLPSLAGGAERQLFELARQSDKNKFELIIDSLECGRPAPSEISQLTGCRLMRFPVKRIYGLSGLRQGIRFIRFLKNENIDIIVTYHFSSDIWGTVLGKMAGVPVIISSRRDMGFWRRPRHDRAYRFINRWVNKVIVNANAIKEKIVAEEGLSEEKVVVIRNGVDAEQVTTSPRHQVTGFSQATSHQSPVTSLKEELEINDDDLVIMHVANFSPVKGHLNLLQAFATLSRRWPNLKMVLIGHGKLENEMKRSSRELEIANRTLFLGERKDVSQLLAIADICVLPSFSEGMSNAILEYMAAGKPVVATNVGGTPELIEHETTGLLVEKGDVGQLTLALEDLIAHKEKREFLGENAYQKVHDEFSFLRMVGAYEDLFQTLAKSRPRALAEPRRNTPKFKFRFKPKFKFQLKKESSHPTHFPVSRRVLHLISSTGFFGAERIALTLCQNLPQEGWETVLGIIRDKRQATSDLGQKAELVNVPKVIFSSQGRFDIWTLLRIRKYVQDKGIGLIHSHNYKSDIIGLWAARQCKIPIIATVHGFTDMTPQVSWYEGVDRLLLSRYFTKVVTVNHSQLKRLPATKRSVIHNGIDLQANTFDKNARKEVRQRYRLAERDFVIGTVGRFTKEKNQILLLNATYPLMVKDSTFKVLVVGDGSEREKLRRFASDRYLEHRVIFTGVLKDVREIYSALDVFVLPSLTEGIPLTLLEAISARIPVIATRVGGIPEIIQDGVNGILVPSGDAVALRKAIERLMRDPKIRQQLAAAGEETVRQNFTQERMVKEYARVYGEFLRERVLG